MTTTAEQNYLKAIYKLGVRSDGTVSTNAIAKELKTSAASVTEMLKRLSEKELVLYEKYKGVQLPEKGNALAKDLIRKHRIWEVFLLEKLHYKWDEVHEIAEQLEHIESQDLIDRLDDFLGNPTVDPHGDPIPDRNGQFASHQRQLLSDARQPCAGIIVGVREHTGPFLKHLDRIGLTLGAEIEILECFEYDHSVNILLAGKELSISGKVADNVYIKIQKT